MGVRGPTAIPLTVSASPVTLSAIVEYLELIDGCIDATRIRSCTCSGVKSKAAMRDCIACSEIPPELVVVVESVWTCPRNRGRGVASSKGSAASSPASDRARLRVVTRLARLVLRLCPPPPPPLPAPPPLLLLCLRLYLPHHLLSLKHSPRRLLAPTRRAPRLPRHLRPRAHPERGDARPGPPVQLVRGARGDVLRVGGGVSPSRRAWGKGQGGCCEPRCKGVWDAWVR